MMHKGHCKIRYKTRQRSKSYLQCTKSLILKKKLTTTMQSSNLRTTQKKREDWSTIQHRSNKNCWESERSYREYLPGWCEWDPCAIRYGSSGVPASSPCRTSAPFSHGSLIRWRPKRVNLWRKKERDSRRWGSDTQRKVLRESAQNYSHERVSHLIVNLFKVLTSRSYEAFSVKYQ